MNNLQNQVMFSDYNADAEEAARKRRIAEQLRAESQTPLPVNQMAGNVVVPISPLSGLAKMLNAYNAREWEKQASEDKKRMAERVTKDATDWITGMPQAKPEILGPTPEEPPMPSGAMVQPDRATQLAWALKGLQNPVTSGAAAKMAERVMTPFDPNTNLAKLNPKEFTDDSWAQYVRTGDSTALRPRATPNAMLGHQMAGAQLAAKLHMWGNLSAQQQAQLAKEIQEYNLNAAKFGFESGVQMPPMSLPTGPVPTPNVIPPTAQPPQAAPQPAPAPQPAAAPTPTPALPSYEDALARAKQIVQNGGSVRNMEFNGATAPQQPAGTPLVQGNPALSPKAQQKLVEDRPAAEKALGMTTNFIDTALRSIENIQRNAGGVSGITGPVAGRLPSFSKNSVNAQADLDALKAQMSAQALQAMRDMSKTGGAVGQVTEREWPRLESLLGSLNQVQSTEQFWQRLGDVKARLEDIRGQAEKAYRDTYGGTEPAKPASPGGWSIRPVR